MQTSVSRLCLILALVSLGDGAHAMLATDLELIPSSDKCRREAMNLKPLFDSRDEGMSRENALVLVDRANGIPVSRRAVNLAYDFPAMPRDAITVYTLWGCHALEHYVAINPMASFVKDFEECYAQPAWQRGACANVLWNRVHGLPDDHKSKAKPVVITKTPPTFQSSAASHPDYTAPVIVAPPPAPLPERPRLEHCPKPEYPAAALRADVQGTTVVKLAVAPSGTVTRSEVSESSGDSREHKILDRAAHDALRQCKFNAIQGAGERTARLSYTFAFTVEPAPSAPKP